MANHTPGPWHRNIRPATKYPTIFAGRSTHIATLCAGTLPSDEVEANCDLIAAAPDMLAALEAWITLRDMKGARDATITIARAMEDAATMGRVAVAKARGG